MTMQRCCLILLLALCASVSAVAQKTRRVSAEYTYVSDNKEETPAQAVQSALQQARYEAVRREFGERVTNQTDYIASEGNGKGTETFRQHSGTELKADWIETISEEVREQRFDRGYWTVTVYVEGRAQEIASAGVDFEYHILRNGTELRHEDRNFRNRDRLYLQFKAPVDGYLAVYVVDDMTAYCILPYQEQADGIYRVKANQEYTFFSEQHLQPDETGFHPVMRLVTSADTGAEVNEVYVIFSTKPFTKRTDREGTVVDQTDKHTLTLARNIPIDDFHDWLARCRQREPQMRVERAAITIRQ